MMAAETGVNKLVNGLIFAIVGVILLPVMMTFLNEITLTGTADTLLGMIPLLYIVALVVGIITYITKSV